MKKKDIAYFETVLNEKLSELLRKEIPLKEMDPSDYPSDFFDRADIGTSRDFEFRIRTRENFLIRKIVQTLDNIKNGDFGICEDCGDDIPVNRLKARPVTTHCIDCKRKQEAAERLAS
jgi:DnaK suppressor protein